jgi:hypothetical protein
MDDHRGIAKKINKIFYNYPSLGYPFEPGDPTMSIYRVTKIFPDIDINSPRSFSYPPNPKLGRANIAGYPVFYGSLNPMTALREMRSELKVGETLYLSEWKLDFQKPVVAHTLFNNSVTTSSKVLTTKSAEHQMALAMDLIKGATPKQKEGFKQLIIRLGDLFSMEGSEYYNISSAFAHDLMYEAKTKGLGFEVHIIIYPSIAVNHNGVNVAIHPRLVDSDMMKLSQVLKLTVREVGTTNVKTDVSERGKPDEHNSIDWRLPSYTIKSVNYEGCSVLLGDNSVIKGTEALGLKVGVGDILVKDFIRDAIYKDVLDGLSKQTTAVNIFEFESAERNHIARFLASDNTTMQDLTELSGSVKQIEVPFTWIEDYRIKADHF